MNEVDIANMALSNIGEIPAVTSLNPIEGSAHAEVCAQYMPIAKGAVIGSQLWGFNRKRVALSLLAGNSNRWQYMYAYPSDCVKASSVAASEAMVFEINDYEIGRNDNNIKVIYCNIQDAVLTYGSDNYLIDDMPTLLHVSLSWALSSMIAMPITRDSNIHQTAIRSYRIMLDEAMASDRNESRSSDEVLPNWIDAR